MHRFAILALMVGLSFSSCKTIQEPLEKHPVYKEADYFALIQVEYVDRAGNRSSDEFPGSLINHRDDYYVVTDSSVQSATATIQNIRVTFKVDKSRSYEFRLLGWDRFCRTAVLAPAPGFSFDGNVAKLGDSDEVREGQKVFSLGHFDGDHWNIRVGKVRDTDHEESGFVCRFIRHSTDTGSGSGREGGPVLNNDGEVVAMNVGIKEEGTLSVKGNDMKARLDALIAGFRN